jgi:hypothetical protein
MSKSGTLEQKKPKPLRSGVKQASPKLRGGLDPSIGKATQFQPGQSPNPGGRPKTTAITDAYLKLLPSKFPGDPKGRTYAELLAEGQLKEGIKGKTPAAKEITDRTEGPVVHAVEIANSGKGPLEFHMEVEFVDPEPEPK